MYASLFLIIIQVDDDKSQIVVHILPIDRHKQSYPSHDWYKSANDDKDQILTTALWINKHR